MRGIDKLKESFPAQLLRRYFRHEVSRTAAALTYYLIFSIFPLTVFLSALLGALNLDIAAIAETMARFVPREVVALVESYLNYVNRNIGPSFLIFGLIFSVYFPMRAVDTLMRAARKAYHFSRPEKPVRYFLKKLIYTLFFILTIVLSLALVVAGRKALDLLGTYIPMPQLFVSLWPWLRFGAMALIMFFLLTALHVFARDSHAQLKAIFPGVILSLLLWLFASVAFSFYVTNFSKYSLLYGSIGAIIVLLLWLYITSVIMVMGAECNALLMERKRKNKT